MIQHLLFNIDHLWPFSLVAIPKNKHKCNRTLINSNPLRVVTFNFFVVHLTSVQNYKKNDGVEAKALSCVAQMPKYKSAFGRHYLIFHVTKFQQQNNKYIPDDMHFDSLFKYLICFLWHLVMHRKYRLPENGRLLDIWVNQSRTLRCDTDSKYALNQRCPSPPTGVMANDLNIWRQCEPPWNPAVGGWADK